MRSNVVYKSEWMAIYEDQVYKRNDFTSKVGVYNRIDVCDTVIVIPLFKDGSLLMVENYRHGVGTNLLELPGGFINKGEVPLSAARRELIEETGYTCNKVKVVNWFYTWPAPIQVITTEKWRWSLVLFTRSKARALEYIA